MGFAGRLSTALHFLVRILDLLSLTHPDLFCNLHHGRYLTA
jgi:hypothetical protein